MSFVSEFKKNKMLQAGEEDDYTRLKKRIKENGVKITGVKDEEAEQWLRKATSTADERTKYSKNTSYKGWKTKNKYMYEESSDLYKRGKEIQAYLNAKARDDESYAGYRDSTNELLKELSRSTNSMIASDQKYGRFGSESEYNNYINEQEKIKRVRDATRRSKIKSKSQQMNEGLRKDMGLENTTLGSEKLENAVALDRLKKRISEKNALEKDTQYYKRLLTDDSQMDANTRRQALEKLKRTIMTEQIAGDSKTLSGLSKSFSNATGKKVSQTDAYQMLENAQGQIDRDKYDQKMGEKRKELEKVLDEKGFETAAKKGSQIAQKKTVYNADMLAGYQNEDKSYPDIFKNQTEYEQYQDMTDTEKDVFDYYLATEGVQKAKEYLNTIKRDITKRQNEAYKEKMKQYATEHPVLSSDSSVAAGFATGLGALETMRQNAENVLTGNNAPVDINSKPFRPINAQSTIRNTVMENFQGSEDVKALKRFLYQTGMSMADFGTQAAAGALVGGFAGEAASLAGASAERAAQITATISKNASLPIMGAGAMSQTVKEVIENGGTNDQAMQLGLIAGAAEMVTERLGIDNLSKLSSQGVNSVKRAVHKIIAEGAIPEGLEEVVSDIVNNVANDAIMQENSDFNQDVERYMTPNAMTGEHISRRQAEDLAMKDRIKDMALSFAGGALSGGIMAAGAYGSGYIEGGYLGRELNSYEDFSDAQLIRDGKAMTGTNSADLAEYYEGKGKLSDRQRAELFNQILQDSDGKYTPSPEITQNEAGDTKIEEGAAQEAKPVELTAEDLQEPQIEAQTKEKKEVQENVRQREKEPETGTQRSVEGVNYKGLQGNIEGIDRVENGKIYARVNTGDATIVQPVSNLNFDNAVTQALYQTAEGYKNAGARNFVMEYNGESLIAYKKGFNAYYDAATVGIPMRKVNNVYGNMLTERQKAAAYTAGETDLNFEQRYENLKAERETKTAGSQVLENDAFRSLTKENQTILKAYAKMSGANVVVDETISAGNGRYANGYYDNNGTIHIAADATSPISVVANHELTHYLQQYSPIYDEYKKEVINYLMQKENMPLDGLIERHMSNYENAGRQISREEAMDEIVANASELFLTDESAVQQLVKENKSIGEKILDFFKEFISNLKEMLTGYEPKSKEAQMLNESMEAAQKAEKIWLEAMQDARQVGRKTTENSATGGEIKKSFSPKEDMNFSIREEGGERYVNVDTDQELFEGMDDAEAAKTAKTIIKDRFQGKKLEKNALVSSKTAGEYTHPAKRMKKDAYRAKMQASTELDNLVKVSEFIGHKNDENGRHGKMAANGWDYYKTIFRLGDRYFEGKVNIAKGADADVLYDITDIKEREIAKSPSGQSKENPISISNLSENNITNAEGKVNEKDIRYQMEDASEVDYDTLKAENKDLKELNSILGGMIKATKGIEPDQEAIKKVGKKILKDYNSDYNLDTFTRNMTGIWKYISGSKNIDAEQVAIATADMAKGILEHAKVNVNERYAEQYKDLAKEVRQIKLEVPEEMRGDFDREGGYAEFRKRNFGTLKLGKEGQSIDSYYQSLAERYPELFDETIYTNPADQLMHIAEVMESIKPKYENAFGMDLDEAAADLAHEIYQSYFDIAAGKGSIDSIRKNVIEKERLKYKKYREKMRDDYKKYREEYRGNFAQRRKENFEKKAYSKNIEQTANRLSRWLLNPTNTNSVPESLRGPVAEFLNSINLSSKDVNVYGNPTQRTLKWQALSRAYENIIKAQDKSEYTGQFIDLDPDLVNMLNDLTEKNKEVMLADMTVQDMKELNRLIMAVKKSIESTNTLLATENYKRVSDLGEKFLEENREKESAKESAYRTVNTARNFMKLDMLDSRTYFNSLGKAGMDIYGALRNGLDKKTRNIKIAHDYIKNLMGETDISEWSGDKAKLHEFKTEEGKELKLTTAQVMSLYRLLQRDQAKEHILEGGIRPEKTITKAGKLKKEVTRYYEPIRVTEKDLMNIIDTLTPEQKRIADGITDFFTSTTSAWGNEVSMQLYGYRKFMARNYFPIVSDNSFTNSASGDQQGSVQTLKNMGSTKATVPHAGNPIILQDIFDVYARQSDQMASYNAFVVPLTDLQKWYNYRGDPTVEKYTRSVKQTITRTMGQNGRAYLDTLVRRINGVAEKETAKQIWSSLTSNMKSAAIGANLRVVLQQPTAIVRAATVIDAKYLMKGMAKKANGDQMKKYAPIAQWKDWGYFEMDTGRQMKDVILGKESLKDKAMAPAGMADDFTWGKIWNAVLYETKDKTDLKPGSEEFYQAAGKRFSEIIDRTQVVDSILHRSSVMIQKDNATKMATSFMSEPIKTYNMVYDTLMNTPGGKKEVAKSMAKLLVILTVQNAVNALAQTLADVWRDDDDETAWMDVDTWKDNFKDNMNPLTYIPYLKEIPSIWKGYSAERTEMTGITDSVQGLQKWIKYFQGESKYTAAGLVRESMKPISELSGMPINSTLREFESLADLIAWNYRKITGNETAKAEYEIKKTFYRAGNPKNTNMFIGLYGRAREEGDYKTAAAIYNDLQKAGNTKERLDNAYKKWKKKRDEGLLEADEGLQKEITEAYKNNDMETFKSASEELKSKGIDINTALDQIEDEEKEEEEYEVSEVTPEDLQKEDNTAELYTLLYMATQNNDTQAQNTYKKQLKEAGEKEEDFQKNLLKEQNAKAKATGGTEYSYDALFNALVSTEGKNGKKYKEIEQGLKKYGKEDSAIKTSMKSRLKTAYMNSRGNDRLTKKYYDLLRSFGVDTQTIKGWLE